MSCEQNPGKAARAGIFGGISQLASKRGYYAGLALKPLKKVAGMVGAARRISDARRQKVNKGSGKSDRALSARQPIPQLSARAKARPFVPRSSDRCTECKTPAGSKGGSWYAIGSGAYCQDCAPGAAHKANVDLTAGLPVGQTKPWPSLNLKPAAATSKAAASSSSAARPRPIPSPAGAKPRQNAPSRALPMNNPVPTRMEKSRVGIVVGRERTPVVAQGFVLLKEGRSGLQETGLAVTPAIEAKDGQFYENTDRWSLTHITSGIAVTDAVYSPEEAQKLGSVLARLDWSREQDDIPINDLYRAQDTIKRFNAMRTTANGITAPPAARTKEPEVLPLPTQPVPDQSITGSLVADAYGGLARVIEDNGDTLFLVDSTGTRYELPRGHTRTPDEFDFSVNRVARPFDPATAPEESCARCSASAGGASAGDKWHKMDRQSFCGACASGYADKEGFCLADEINTGQEMI